jgi:phage terminase large subunit
MGRKSKVTEAQMMVEEELGHSFMFDSDPEPRELSIVATDLFYRNQAATAPLVINRGGRGSGKCFVPGTEVVMADNSLKKIEDIKVGDLVLGVDLKPSEVVEIHKGFGSLYKIKQQDRMSYTVNHRHTLCLFRQSKFVEIEAGDFIVRDDKDSFFGYGTKDGSLKFFKISISYDGEGHYYGFSLKGSKKFFLKDFTVVHNSHAIAQLLLYKFFNEDRKKILILRKSLPSLRLSTYKLMTDLAMEYGVYDRIVVEKVHMNWYYNGSMIHFGSVDESAKIRSSNWNILFIEEATEITYDDFQDIRFCIREPSRDGLRNQIFLAFNPIDEFHWIKEKMLDDPTIKTDEIVSNYKDNPFLPDDYVQLLLDLEAQDATLYNIFTLGNWGRLDDLIYKNWDIVKWTPDDDQVDFVTYGLDFGWNSPSALIKLQIKKPSDVWEEELLYHRELTNENLIVKMKEIIPEGKRRSSIIWADSERPDCIKEINQAGFNCKPAIKQVKPGIDIVKRMNCHVLETSINIIKEKRAYSWKKDKQGNKIDEPVGWMDHLMDAERYGLHSTIAKLGSGFRLRFI